MEERILTGKSKRVRFFPEVVALSEFEFLDSITAFNGKKKDEIPDKGSICNKINHNCFEYLNDWGIPTHYLGPSDGNKFYARTCKMIPYEIVVRRVATGSYLTRYPGFENGFIFHDPVVEYFLKDDALGDPWVEQLPEAVSLTNPYGKMEVSHPIDSSHISYIAIKVFLLLENAFHSRNAKLVDCKFEFGINKDRLFVCDSLDNECWRLIYQGKDISKQSYRDDASLEEVLKNYEIAHSLTCGF